MDTVVYQSPTKSNSAGTLAKGEIKEAVVSEIDDARS